MPERRRIADCDRVLVVEGHSDLFFYLEMLRSIGDASRVFIQELRGKTRLKEKIEDFVTPSLKRSKVAMGFIVDADDNPYGTRASLEAILRQVFGRQEIADGRWTGENPKVGLMVVPGAGQKGEIETLVWQSWSAAPSNQSQKRCVEQYLACMQTDGRLPKSLAKGLIGAMLAIRNDDDPRLGPGARAKIFDLSQPGFEALRRFLTELLTG